MRDRHLPRLCRACNVPMARQEDACWSCGTPGATEDQPRPELRVIQGGRATDIADLPQLPLPAVAAAALPIPPDDGGAW